MPNRIHAIGPGPDNFEYNHEEMKPRQDVSRGLRAWQSERLLSWDTFLLYHDYLQNIASDSTIHMASHIDLIDSFMCQLMGSEHQTYLQNINRLNNFSSREPQLITTQQEGTEDAVASDHNFLTEIPDIHQQFTLDDGFRPLFIFPEENGVVTLVGDGKGQVVCFSPAGERIWSTYLNLKKLDAAYTIFDSHLPNCKTLILYLLDNIVVLNAKGRIIKEIHSPCPYPTSAHYAPETEFYHLQSSADGNCYIYDTEWKLVRTYEKLPGLRKHNWAKRLVYDPYSERMLVALGGRSKIQPFHLAAYDRHGNFMEYLPPPPIADYAVQLCIDDGGIIYIAGKRTSMQYIDPGGKLLTGPHIPPVSSLAVKKHVLWLIERGNHRLRAFILPSHKRCTNAK